MGLKMSVRLDEILAEHKQAITLPDNAAREFESSVFNYLMIYDKLATAYATMVPQKKLFTKTFKCHYLGHVGLEVWEINPRLLWCYRGEDYMKISKRILKSCVRGAVGPAACAKALRKYLYGKHVRYLDHFADA